MMLEACPAGARGGEGEGAAAAAAKRPQVTCTPGGEAHYSGKNGGVKSQKINYTKTTSSTPTTPTHQRQLGDGDREKVPTWGAAATGCAERNP